MKLLIFYCMLAAAALLGGGIGAVFSHLPGRRGGFWLRWPLLCLTGLGCFVGALCLRAGTRNPAAVVDRYFPDRLSKLFGCGLLLILCCALGLLLGFLRAGGLRRFFRAVSGSRVHRLAALGLFVSGAGIVLGCSILAKDGHPFPLRLNEVCLCNFSMAQDPDTGEYADYIEIVNTGTEPVNLDGCFLSDNGKKRGRFRLPAQLLQPGECVLLWPDGAGSSGQRSGKGIHLDFKLQEGETLWFSSPSGTLLDHVKVPDPIRNVSLSRMDDEWVLAGGTPGWSNGSAIRYQLPTLEAPGFSLASGFYDEPQTLTLSCAQGCEIRYTLDGSIPDPDSLRYEGPLTLTDISSQPNLVLNHPTTTIDRSGVITEPVDKGTMIRAAAFNSDGERSETVSAVYFVGRDRFSKYEGRTVLNIVAAPDDLFGNFGIAVTGLDYDRWLESGGEGNAPYPFFYRSGRKLERDAELFLWDDSHQLLMNEACGIRLQGDHTRAQTFKRFRLIARSFYGGSSSFSVPLFGVEKVHSFYNRRDSADVIAQMLADGLGLGGLDAIPAAIFINGEFYHDDFLRERYDKEYFTQHFGVDKDDLILISNHTLSKGTEADYQDYLDFLAYISDNDCTDPAVWAEICSRMDVENYARYVALNVYCDNTDWSVYKNYKLWRTREALDDGFRDGRWRWLVYDMDGCTWSSSKEGYHRLEFDPFLSQQPYTERPFLELEPFADLLKNPEFKSIFVSAWLDLMNTVLIPENAERLFAKYGVTDDSFWIGFLRDRPPYAIQNLIRDLELTGTPCALRLEISDPSGGSVQLDGLPLELSAGARDGNWITGVSLTLRAQAAEGWRFVGWEGDAADAGLSLTLTPQGDTVLRAVFEKIPSQEGR